MFSCLKSIILICLLAISFSSLGQTALSLKISTLSFNFIENKYPDKFNLQLDNNGRLSIEPSIIIGYERFFSDLPLSIRFSQGLGIDVAGKLLFQQIIAATESTTLLDLRSYPAGVYMVKVTQNNQTHTQRLVLGR